MASLATFNLNGTEYQISDENMDMDTLKSLLLRVLSKENNQAIAQRCHPDSQNDDWFESILAEYNSPLSEVATVDLSDEDDETLLKSL